MFVFGNKDFELLPIFAVAIAITDTAGRNSDTMAINSFSKVFFSLWNFVAYTCIHLRFS